MASAGCRVGNEIEQMRGRVPNSLGRQKILKPAVFSIFSSKTLRLTTNRQTFARDGRCTVKENLAQVNGINSVKHQPYLA